MHHSQAVSDQNLPAELFPNYCTLEYTLQAPVAPSPPAYVFVVDTCLAEDELAACRASLSQALQMIPEYAQVRGIHGRRALKWCPQWHDATPSAQSNPSRWPVKPGGFSSEHAEVDSCCMFCPALPLWRNPPTFAPCRMAPSIVRLECSVFGSGSKPANACCRWG